MFWPIYLEYSSRHSSPYSAIVTGESSDKLNESKEGAPHMQEEPHETDCTSMVGGKECADRHVPLKKMCKGCKLYWTEAAKLANKTTEQWISETVAEHEAEQPEKADSLTP